MSLSIVVSNPSPSRAAMMAMPCRPTSPLSSTASPGRTNCGPIATPGGISPIPAVEI